MHDGMPYGRIQGQGQGHEPLKVWIPSIFKTYLLRHLQWELESDHKFLNYSTISKFDRVGFLIFVLVSLSRDSELDQNLSGDLRKNFASDLNDIWYVGRGRWVMHDGMPYGRIQGQGQGHSREVDRQSPTGLIFIIIVLYYLTLCPKLCLPTFQINEQVSMYVCRF